MGVRFEVEHAVLIARKLPVLLARQLDPGNFTVTEGSTIRGSLVAPSLEIPRSLHADGGLRMDLFAFTLLNAEHLVRFRPGDHVLLEPAS